MGKIEIIMKSTLADLSSQQLFDWKNYLKLANDPRSVFQEPDFFFETPNIFTRIQATLSFLIYQDKVLVGLFTFVQQNVAVKLNFGLLNLTSRKCNEIRSVGCGTLQSIDALNQKKVRSQLLLALKKEAQKNASYVFFEAIEENDLFYDAKDSNNSFTQFHLNQSETFIATIEEDFNTFLKGKTKSKRQSINKDLKRFEKAYEGRFNIRKDPLKFIDLSKTVLARSWKKGLVGSIVGSQGFEEQLSLLTKHDLVSTFVLEVDEEPIAFAIGYRSGINFFYEEIAYDEKFAKSGAGSYLTINVVKALHENVGHLATDNKPLFSFGVGDNIYKRKLYSHKFNSKNMMLSLPYSEASFIFHLKSILNSFYHTIRKIIVSLNLHTLIRQKMKQRAAK